MTGILYQDFCTAKGKWMLRILAACVLILIGMVIWGDPDGMDGALFLAILGLIAVCYGISIPEKIFASDEKNSIRTFLLSLPTGGRKYVQEKYAFMGIYYYTLANLLVVLQRFVLGGNKERRSGGEYGFVHIHARYHAVFTGCFRTFYCCGRISVSVCLREQGSTVCQNGTGGISFLCGDGLAAL